MLNRGIKYRYIGDFYLKGLNHKLKFAIWQYINREITNRDRKYILDKKNNYANVYSELWTLVKNEDDMNKFIARRKPDFEKINAAMESAGRKPLFVITDDLVEAMEFRDFLLQFLPEEECCKILGCKSFDDFQPPMLENN